MQYYQHYYAALLIQTVSKNRPWIDLDHPQNGSTAAFWPTTVVRY